MLHGTSDNCLYCQSPNIIAMKQIIIKDNIAVVKVPIDLPSYKFMFVIDQIARIIQVQKAIIKMNDALNIILFFLLNSFIF